MRNETLERVGGPAVLTSVSPTTILRLVRSADQLDIVLELLDAVVVDGTDVVASGPAPAVRITFGSQHVSERTFTAANPAVPTGAIGHIAAGPSVVVAPITGSLPFTIDGIFSLAGAAAGLAAQATAGEPDGSVTAVEVPAGLVLSPATPARLVAARAPFVAADTTEVWTASLESIAGTPSLDLGAIQNLSPTDLVVTRTPDAAARDAIVANSTTLAPLSSRRMWLTSSGAFADLHGEWDTQLSTGLALYDHRLAAGRDLHVEVVTLGYLLPFGHRAAIAEVTERVFVDDKGGGQTSVMQTRRFLNIVDPLVTTPRAFARNGGRGLPLMSLTATTDETAPLRIVPVNDEDGNAIDGASDLKRAGTASDLVVDYLTVDRAGNSVSFAMPATFIDDANAHQTGADEAPARLRAVANAEGRRSRRTVDLQGQPVAYADPLALGEAISKATHEVVLNWEAPADGTDESDLDTAGTPAVFAALEHANVVDDVIGSVTGEIGDLIGVTLHPRWLDFGNAVDNFDLAFLHLDQPASSLIGANTAVGGVAQLDILAEVFNQSAGVGPDRDAPIPFDLTGMLGAASKIIGNILLSAVVEAVEDGLPGVDIPGTTVTIDGDTVTVSFTFCPKLHDLPPVGFRTVEGETRCCIHLTTVASLSDTVEASFTTEMRVDNFLLDFPPVAPTPIVVVDFESVVGTIDSVGATSIVPTIREWDFSGAISMLLALVDHLGLGNVDLKILDDVIDMDSSINLPDISLGVAELKNFSINLGFDLPLDDGAGQLSFGIGKKSGPLDIDVLMFGATFWLEMGLGFSGDVAPASTIAMGLSVYWEMLDFDIVVVDISFTLRLSADWKLTGDDVVFTGAVSLEGEIEVLGLISVSAAIVASLTYDSAEESMVLKGTVNYCVDSFLGKLTSGSVPIGRTTFELGDGENEPVSLRGVRPTRAQRASAGSPSFQDRYSEPVWADYCDAFA